MKPGHVPIIPSPDHIKDIVRDLLVRSVTNAVDIRHIAFWVELPHRLVREISELHPECSIHSVIYEIMDINPEIVQVTRVDVYQVTNTWRFGIFTQPPYVHASSLPMQMNPFIKKQLSENHYQNEEMLFDFVQLQFGCDDWTSHMVARAVFLISNHTGARFWFPAGWSNAQKNELTRLVAETILKLNILPEGYAVTLHPSVLDVTGGRPDYINRDPMSFSTKWWVNCP